MKRKAMKPKIARDGRGSAMLIVIIAMLFVIVLGITLLFAAYSGYLVKITERKDAGNFYTAAAALDDIRDGLQQQVGKAVKVAYTKTLAANSTDAENVFKTNFYDEVTKIKGGTEKDKTDTLLVTQPPSGSYQYNPAALRTFIADTSAGTYTINNNTETGSAVLAADKSTFTLKGVTVKCVKNGYESEVSADITVALPKFTVGSRASTAIGTTVFVASKGLQCSAQNISVNNSDIYVGGKAAESAANVLLGSRLNPDGTVTGTGNLTFSGCTLNCSGDILLGPSAGFSFGPAGGSTVHMPLWVRNIKLAGSASSVSLNGNINVANDLLLGGATASAALAGNYYGFGSGGTDKTDPDSSSAIVVNGQGCKINVSGLETLSLAGVSFINATRNLESNTTGGSIRTGQSVAAKPDQLAYLVPASCLQLKDNGKLVYTTNPLVLKKSGENYVRLTDENIAGLVNYNKVLWKTDAGTEKTLSDYGITSESQLKLVYPQGKGLGYVFMVFPNQTYANAYYADYYKYGSFNGVAAADYLKQYLTFTNTPKEAAFTYSGAGSAYRNTDAGVELVPASALAETSSSWGSMIAVDYYDRYANRDAVKGLGETTFTYGSGSEEIHAVVTNGNYSFNGNDSKLHLIVAAGDVTIQANFTGTIICDGTVKLAADVTAGRYDELANATATVGGKTLKLTDYVKGFTAGTQATADAWSLDKLVYYENWKKN